MSRERLKTISTIMTPVQTFLPTEAKKADKIYGTQEHKDWRSEVMKRAGWRCQWPGCTKRSPEHRLFADHIVEVEDGGPRLDVANGQALCGTHHTMKTAQARAERHGLKD